MSVTPRSHSIPPTGQNRPLPAPTLTAPAMAERQGRPRDNIDRRHRGRHRPAGLPRRRPGQRVDGQDTRTHGSGVRRTPHPAPVPATTFPNDGGYDELILARGFPVRSVCEHHMLPFIGTAHIGYLPGERIVGLSKLARILEHFSRRPQVQERLTVQVSHWLRDHLGAAGVGVVIEAEHLCMTVRGVQTPGTTTVTSSLLGALRDDPRTRGRIPRPDPPARLTREAGGTVDH